jgi:hypothetical protein
MSAWLSRRLRRDAVLFVTEKPAPQCEVSAATEGLIASYRAIRLIEVDGDACRFEPPAFHPANASTLTQSSFAPSHKSTATETHDEI